MNLRRWTQRRKKDEDFAEEIESHLAHEEDANAARGFRRRKRDGRRECGSAMPARARARVALSFLSLGRGSLARFSVRAAIAGEDAGFTIIAILVIAVGIGVNTAVFSVINTVLLKPLTYPNPQELVMLMNTSREGFPAANVPKFNFWLQQTSIFQQVAAYDLAARG